MERTRVKGGISLIYLPISEVINRLNKVLGVDNWSFEIVSVRRDDVDTDEIVAHVSLTATIGDATVVKHGFGGSSVSLMLLKRQHSSWVSVYTSHALQMP